MSTQRTAPAGSLASAVASFAIPLLAYAATATPSVSWLDSGEFVATGFVLGAAHPPGHPIAVTLLRLFDLLPIGSLALRSALASAVAASVACLVLSRIALRLGARLSPSGPGWVTAISATVGALLLGASPALWAQASRPEVYALQLALLAGALACMAAFGVEPRGGRDGRLIAGGALLFGLSLANHHFLSLLLLPAVIVLLTEDALAGWRRTVRLITAGAVPAGLIGLIPYTHLALRAHAPGEVSLGTVWSFSSLVWVVSARAFQKAVTNPPAAPLLERTMDGALLVSGQLTPIVAVAALGGLYFIVRQRGALGMALALALAAPLLARAWVGFDPSNPDVLGYLLLPVFVLALGASRIGPLMVTIVPVAKTVRFGGATVAAVALLAAVGWVGAGAAREAQRAGSGGAETLAIEQLERLPPRSVLITELFESGYNVWAAQIAEGLRPDVAHFHRQFVGFPGYVRQVGRAHGDLRGVLRSALSRGELGEAEVSTLAQRRPVYLEPALVSSGSLDPFLLPAGLVWEASPEPLGATDLRMALPAHFAGWDRVLVQLGRPMRDEQTLRVVLYFLYVDAMVLARRGERGGALQAVARALLLGPRVEELGGLQRALSSGEGPLDVTPFLLPGARPEPPRPVEPQAPPDVLDF